MPVWAFSSGRTRTSASRADLPGTRARKAFRATSVAHFFCLHFLLSELSLSMQANRIYMIS
ncbi:hypothetical protein METHP15_880016 [Pseudomonas sp. P15-2025]